MRKLFLVILSLQASLCFAQTNTADRVVARQSLYVRDRWVDTIQTDTAFMGKLRSLPTSDAVFRFVLGRLSGISVGSGSTGGTGGVDSVVMSSSLQVDTILTYTGGVAKVVGLFDRSADGLVSGGQVIYRSGLTYDISAAVYRIGGIRYFSPATTVTLPAANSFLPRKDVIALTTLGTAVVVAGTPSDNPVKPQINPATQLELTFADIEAGAPTPTNVTTNVQYDEGTEWSISTTGTITANTASTAQFVSGAKSIAISSWTNGSGVQFTNSSTVSATNFATFSFWLRLTASLSNQQNITVQFFKSGVAASNAVTASVNKTATNAWQIVSFTIGQFTFSSVTFDRVRITLSGSSSTNTLYIDLVQLQAGVSQTGGAAGGLQNAFVSLTDGTNTVQASGADGLTVAGGDSTITTTVSSALKKLTVALNQGKLRLGISQIDSLRALLNGKVDDVFSINHHLFKIKNGVTTEVDSLPNLYFKPRQFFGSGADTTDPLTIVRDSSTATPMNVMWMGRDSSIHIGAYPSGSSSVPSVFGRTGAVAAQSSDYSAFYPLLSGSYANPAWITSLPWTKITGTPTTLSAYGITDAESSSHAAATYQPIGSYVTANSAITGATKAKITYDAKGLVTAGADLVATDIPSLDAAKTTTGLFAAARIASGTATTGFVPTVQSDGSLAFAAASGGSSGWGLTGNAATAGNSAGSFLGTTNNVSLRIRTNNVQRLVIDTLGNLTQGDNTSFTITSTPLRFSMGGTYGNSTPGSGANVKFAIYEDGIPADISGIGFSTNSMEIRSGNGQSIRFYSSNSTTTRLEIDAAGTVRTPSAPTGAAALSLGSQLGNTRLALYDGYFGIGVQTSQFRFHLGGGTEQFLFLDNAAGNTIFAIRSDKRIYLTPITQTQRDALTGLGMGDEIMCSNCTATDGSTGVKQTYNGAAWKNHW